MEASSIYYRNQLKPFLVEIIISLRTKIHTTVLEEMQLLPLTVEPFPNSYYLWNKKLQGLIIWIWTHLGKGPDEKLKNNFFSKNVIKQKITPIFFYFLIFFSKWSYLMELTKIYTNNGLTFITKNALKNHIENSREK